MFSYKEFLEKAPSRVIAALPNHRDFTDYSFKRNENRSWEAWPPDTCAEGVELISEDGSRSGNSDYMDDAWLDDITGIPNWRGNVDETQ